jgi:hypothetical protein
MERADFFFGEDVTLAGTFHGNGIEDTVHTFLYVKEDFWQQANNRVNYTGGPRTCVKISSRSWYSQI